MSQEKAVELLSDVLKMKPEEVVEKLTTEDGVKELSDRKAALKVYTNDEFLSIQNNYKDSLKDIHYKESKINIHQALEKDLANEYELSAEEIAGLKTTKEYINKAIEKKIAKLKTTPGDNNKEIETLQKALDEKVKLLEELPKKAALEANEKVKNIILNSEIRLLASGVEFEGTEDEKTQKLQDGIDYLKYKFNQQYSIGERDGKEIVLTADGEPLRDENTHKLVSVNEVLSRLSTTVFPKIKPADGGRPRDNSKNGKDNGAIDLSMGWDEFRKTERGSKLIIGSREFLDLKDKFEKAKN